MTTPGNLFFDPLVPGMAAGSKPGDAGGNEPSLRQRGTQTAAEQQALRAASLMQVSRDLQRMARERARSR